MDELKYWKLKAQMAEIGIMEMEHEKQLVLLNARKSSILKEAGFEPKNYKWNDEKFELEEMSK